MRDNNDNNSKNVIWKHSKLLRTKIAWEEFEGEGKKGIGHFLAPKTLTFDTMLSRTLFYSDNEFHFHENKKSFS